MQIHQHPKDEDGLLASCSRKTWAGGEVLPSTARAVISARVRSRTMSVNWDHLEETGTEGHTNALPPLHIWGTLAYIGTQVSALWQPFSSQKSYFFSICPTFSTKDPAERPRNADM